MMKTSTKTRRGATVTFISNGRWVTRKIPRDATATNGPLTPLWNKYDALGRPSDMFQDSWGRLV